MAAFALTLLCLAALPGATSPAAAARSSAGAAIVLSPAVGPTGTVTTVTGSGFGRKAAVTVTVAMTSTQGVTDAKGRFVVSLPVSAEVSGAVLVTAGSRDAVASAPFTVTSPPATGHECSSGARFGVTTPGGPAAAQELDEVTTLAGEAPSIVMWYRGFGQELDVSQLDAVAARGAEPLITWEPYDWTQGVEQPQYALARIAAGDFDPYLQRWADGLRAHGHPVMLRFAHEMNGTWYPWSEAVNGNAAGDYVAAWRHVHSVFASAGVTNVRWVWSPNVSYAGSLPMAGLYPGAAYVDVVALDGYNWGTAFPGTTWQSPAQVFGASLDEARAAAPGKPLMIAETASAEAGGTKSSWISELFVWLPTQPDVEAFVWFHHDKETDWRIDSSEPARAAFADGLAAMRR